MSSRLASVIALLVITACSGSTNTVQTEHPRRGPVTGVAVLWNDEEGWGAVASPAVDGEVWTHFSDIEGDGYKSLRVGQAVTFTYETPGQDGYPHRALSVKAVPVNDDDEVPADRYEALTGTSTHDYEQQLLRAARHTLIDDEPVRADSGEVESVELVGEGADAKLAVIFRVANRTGRTFGWRIPIWPAPDPHDDVVGTPKLLSELFPVYLDEAINTIPFDQPIQPPDADGIEWVLHEG